eukprot:TRINITY_DN7696_c0_g1_i1.p1 TRINITY_DN7696_c0_g1~~TRINITY_DN7696_c0_g1_i1.p1  ORF type:complete len:132 (+),score=23.99 TRINITY_DN7696_c0_g1_i1:110-505(+)
MKFSIGHWARSLKKPTFTKKFMSQYSAVFVTAPNDEVATKVASALLTSEPPLIACANIVPGIKSMYLWEGKLETSNEQLIMIKTETKNVEEVIKVVKTNHTYTVPEVISVEITNGNPDYLKWISDSVKGTK